jgi:hypothetical protein
MRKPFHSPVYPDLTLPGFLQHLAGTIIFLGISAGEIFYSPSYSTAVNNTGDLGSTRPLNGVIYQPSALIFSMSTLIGSKTILDVSSG